MFQKLQEYEYECDCEYEQRCGRGQTAHNCSYSFKPQISTVFIHVKQLLVHVSDPFDHQYYYHNSFPILINPHIYIYPFYCICLSKEFIVVVHI